MTNKEIIATMQAKIIASIKDLVIDLETVEEIEAARIACSAPFNEKRTRLKKAQMEERNRIKEEAAEKFCRTLSTGDKLLMQEHGFLNIFNPGMGDTFFNAACEVHVYQPRKRILWLKVSTTKGKESIRPFRLHEVASYNVRRPE